MFGSRATGRTHPGSDLDLGVYIDVGARDTLDCGGLRAALIERLMQETGRADIDLVVLNQAPPMLYHRVLRDGRRIVSRDPRSTTRREALALGRWCDWEPIQRRIGAAVRTRLRAASTSR